MALQLCVAWRSGVMNLSARFDVGVATGPFAVHRARGRTCYHHTRDARWYEQERTRLHERALERERHSAAPPPPPSTSCLQLRVSRRARAAAGAMFMKF
jgi:hypothetical protein